MELRETFLGEQRILEKEKGSLKVEAVFHKAGEPTANGRLYSRELMAREIKKANEAIEKGEYPIGLSDHPTSGHGRTTDVSHLWEKVEIDEDGTCKGVIRILNTPSGRAIQEILKHRSLGVSLRGTGDVERKTITVGGAETEVEEVQDNYRMLSPGDFVLNPSVKTARTGKIVEGKLRDGVVTKEVFDELVEVSLRSSFASNEYATDYKKFRKDRYDFYKTVMKQRLLSDGLTLLWETEEEKKDQQKTEEQKRHEEEVKFYSLFNEYRISGGEMTESEFRKKIYEGEN